MSFLTSVPMLFRRAHFGALAGDRFLLLKHTGRNTGLARETVLEVLVFDHNAKGYYVVELAGGSADWYKNVQTYPHVWIEIGTQELEAIAAPASADQVRAALQEFGCAADGAFSYVASKLGFRPGDEPDRLMAHHPVVHLRTTQPASDPASELAGVLALGGEPGLATAYERTD